MARQSAHAYKKSRHKYTRRNPASKSETIRCRLCGERLKVMGTHLPRRHGITAAEYRERFPGAPTISPETRAMYSDLAVDRWATEAPTGVGPRAERELGVGWAPETCLVALGQFAHLHKRPPRYNELRRAHPDARYPTAQTLVKLFGSFNEALEAAGLPTRGVGSANVGKRRKRCKRGHRLTPENRVEVRPGIFRCRKCLTEYQRTYQRERKRRLRAQ